MHTGLLLTQEEVRIRQREGCNMQIGVNRNVAAKGCEQKCGSCSSTLKCEVIKFVG